ncbi:hypothetical protein AF72_03710 [Xylella taiwanensis]|uniref:Uncharacterized protein n=1 Tax=Xylella taiwanensis TaxID=1444770 RepID=Z9JLI0_9GAMM|nr:hypothetical protein AF72_03710 [Xylella taiwanensis]
MDIESCTHQHRNISDTLEMPSIENVAFNPLCIDIQTRMTDFK